MTKVYQTNMKVYIGIWMLYKNDKRTHIINVSKNLSTLDLSIRTEIV